MGDQLKNWNDDTTAGQAIEMYRGNTRKHTVFHGFGAAANVKDAMFSVENSAGTELIALTKDAHSGQWDLTTDDYATITINEDDTAGVAVSTNYTYAYKFTTYDSPERVFTAQVGTFSLLDEVIDDGATAAYLTRTTRSTYDAAVTALETEISGMMAVADLTQLASAASSGAGSIEVDHIRSIGDTDTIYVQLDTGVYESHTVNGAPVGTTITLTGTLGGDAAAGNFVRKI